MNVERLRMKTTPPEFAGSVQFGPEAIDSNRHVNHIYYMVVFEAQRARWIENCGITIDDIRDRYGISPMVVTGLVNYRGQVLERETVTVYTKAEARSHLVFSQRMLKAEREVANFQCAVAMVDVNGKPQRIPQPLAELIAVGNAKLLNESRET